MKPRVYSLIALCSLFLLQAPFVGAAESAPLFATRTVVANWPDGVDLRHSFVGPWDGRIIAAGGVNLAAGTENLSQAVYVRTEAGDTHAWVRADWDLPLAVAHGASITVEAGLICLAGRTDAGLSDRVFLIHNGSQEEEGAITELPPLPESVEGISAAVLGQNLYVAGGRNLEGPTQLFARLNWHMALQGQDVQWEPLPPWQGPPRFASSLIAQKDGTGTHIYLLGGANENGPLRDAWRFDPQSDCWESIVAPPFPVSSAPTAVLGQAHILVVASDSHQNGRLWGYHTITDTWADWGTLPTTYEHGKAIHHDGTILLTGGDADVCELTLTPPGKNFRGLDIAVLIAYLLVLMGIGFYFSRRENSCHDYFLAGGRVVWWAAGLSIMATQVSSIGFMAIPAKTFGSNWLYFPGIVTWFVVVPIVTRKFIPYFRRMNVTTAYEYLELRFNLTARLLTGLSYILMQLGRMAVVLYLPALALSSVTGIDQTWCVLIMGILCTVYTVAGGIEAVIWTDVLQAILLLGGALFCLLLALFRIEGSVGTFISVVQAEDKLALADWGWDPTAAVLWVVLVGNVFNRLAPLTSDQSIVQRYLTTPDEKQSRKSLWLDVAASIPWAFIVFGFGTVLYVFYKTHPDALHPAVDVDGVVPMFIAQQLPAGLSGLIIAAVFAAAMSSLDSSIHSAATVIVNDGLGRFHAKMSEARKLLWARVFTIVLGAFATFSALLMISADIISLWDFFIKVVGLITGPMAGLFILGMFTRRAHGTGAVTGMIVSLVVMWCVKEYTNVHFFLYAGIGILTCVGVGWLTSVIMPGGGNIARQCEEPASKEQR